MHRAAGSGGELDARRERRDHPDPGDVRPPRDHGRSMTAPVRVAAVPGPWLAVGDGLKVAHRLPPACWMACSCQEYDDTTPWNVRRGANFTVRCDASSNCCWGFSAAGPRSLR